MRSTKPQIADTIVAIPAKVFNRSEYGPTIVFNTLRYCNTSMINEIDKNRPKIILVLEPRRNASIPFVKVNFRPPDSRQQSIYAANAFKA